MTSFKTKTESYTAELANDMEASKLDQARKI